MATKPTRRTPTDASPTAKSSIAVPAVGLIALSEKDFQQQIVELAEALGWHCFHDNDSRRNRAGLPDLELLRGPTMLRLELKTENGIVSPAQEAYIGRLKQIKFVFADVVRPQNWDELVATLKGAAR